MDFQELQYPFEIKKTEIATGEVIAHTDMGDGEPVVFIHGLGSYIPAWSKNLDELSEHFRCIALDLPGYGKSSKELHPGTMEYYSEVVVNLTAELGIEKFSVCGHSMGGTIALKLALLHPEKINKMVLIAPGGAEIYTEEEKHAVQNYLSRGNILNHNNEQIAQNVLVNFHFFPGDAKFMIDDRIGIRDSKDFVAHAEIVARSAVGVMNSDVPLRLSEITTPTLLLFGTEDRMIPNRLVHPQLTPEDVITIFRESIKNLEIKTISECGHFVQFEYPSLFNKTTSHFLLR